MSNLGGPGRGFRYSQARAGTHDQLLRAMDALMDRLEPVKAAVARQLRPLLDDALSMVFYDLTRIRIRGCGAVAEDVRAYGLSKDTGGIARQLRMGKGEADLGTHPQRLRQSVRPWVRCISQRRLRAIMPASVPARARQQAGPGRMASP